MLAIAAKKGPIDAEEPGTEEKSIQSEAPGIFWRKDYEKRRKGVG
jgi:hypothetical protein